RPLDGCRPGRFKPRGPRDTAPARIRGGRGPRGDRPATTAGPVICNSARNAQEARHGPPGGHRHGTDVQRTESHHGPPGRSWGIWLGGDVGEDPRPANIMVPIVGSSWLPTRWLATKTRVCS